MEISLVVIKTRNMEQTAAFYSMLGVRFELHRHESGPLHYSAQSNGVVFEIYPLPASQSAPDTTTRLGFKVKELARVLAVLAEKNIPVISGPVRTEYGVVAVVSDPDGRKVELSES